MTTAAPISAAQAIGEFLQSPDDLHRIPALRKKLEKEKASIDTRLKSGVKEQLDATREGLVRLLGTRNNVQTVKDEMETVERECLDPRNVVSSFDQISAVSTVHRDFAQVEEIVENLLAMNERLAALEEMLEAERAEIPGPAPNLLAIHFQINQLETFRNQTLHQAKKATIDSRNRLNKWFEGLNRVIEAFDEYIIELAKNLLAIAQEGYPDVIVKLIKIAEIEGKADEKAIVIRLVKKAAKLDAAAKFKSMQAEARLIKHYRSKIISAITQSIKDTFEEAFETAPSPGVFVERLDKWMFDDLIQVQEALVPCFPEDYHIRNLFVKEYHKGLDEKLHVILANAPEASLMLTLHGWVQAYRTKMAEIEVPLDLLEPPLLDGKADSLIEDYLAILTQKFNEWTSELMRTEQKLFAERSAPPEEDPDGLFMSENTNIFFNMVNQQVDSAAASGQNVIIAKTIDEVEQVMNRFTQQWLATLDAQFKIQAEKPMEAVAGLDLYTIALANDQVKLIDFVEALLQRIEEMVPDEFKEGINGKLNHAINGFLDVTQRCTKLLIDFILNDLKPAIKSLFSPSWYDTNPIGQIVATMQDYMEDCHEHLHPSLLESLSDELLEAFTVIYLTGLVNTAKLKMPAAAEQVKADAEALFRFFATIKNPLDLEIDFDVIDKVLEMLESSATMAVIPYWRFAKEYGPNLAFVETLMKARDDLDRNAITEFMDAARKRVKDDNITDPDKETIMKKVSIQGNVFSRFLRT